MSDLNKGGDLIFKAGDGGIRGNGGNLNIGPGIYQAGNAIQKNGVSLKELENILIQIIKAHPTLEVEKKEGLIDKLKNKLSSAKDIAQLAVLLIEIFK